MLRCGRTPRYRQKAGRGRILRNKQLRNKQELWMASLGAKLCLLGVELTLSLLGVEACFAWRRGMPRLA
jgi:hypothetical protein